MGLLSYPNWYLELPKPRYYWTEIVRYPSGRSILLCHTDIQHVFVISRSEQAHIPARVSQRRANQGPLASAMQPAMAVVQTHRTVYDDCLDRMGLAPSSRKHNGDVHRSNSHMGTTFSFTVMVGHHVCLTVQLLTIGQEPCISIYSRPTLIQHSTANRDTHCISLGRGYFGTQTWHLGD